MRILLITGLFPPEIGGPASYIPRLGRALAGRHEVEVLTLGEESQEDAIGADISEEALKYLQSKGIKTIKCNLL